MRIVFPSLLALAFLGISACSNSGSVTSAATTKDADLRQTVKSKLDVNPALQQINVSADASRNLVTLSGSVVSEQARTEAVAMAKSAGDNLTIVDKIEVRPQDLPRGAYTGDMARDAREKAKAVGDKLGASLDDAWIYTKIEAKLAIVRNAIRINRTRLDYARCELVRNVTESMRPEYVGIVREAKQAITAVRVAAAKLADFGNRLEAAGGSFGCGILQPMTIDPSQYDLWLAEAAAHYGV